MAGHEFLDPLCNNYTEKPFKISMHYIRTNYDYLIFNSIPQIITISVVC